MAREVEVKFRIDDLEALLAVLRARGIECGPPVVQVDQAYAPSGWSYGMPKRGVSFARLRTVAGRHTFTVKTPRENEQSCSEHETEVADREQMHAAVMAMGFVPTVQIVKTRQVAALDELAICIDQVEHAGTFLELERVVPDEVPGEAVQAELVRFVHGLGVGTERIAETYDSLIHTALASA